ncbi:MAG: ABC transporter substrate-binding protein [Pseudolabrys sp.]|nr:ABC transporter substrate-binding protein [Pseudolabrys sp.]
MAASSLAADLRVGLALNFRIQGPAAPYFIALDNGYYQVEGLNVRIDVLANSTDAIERVVSGTADVGVADLSALIRYRDAQPDAPVKAIFIVYNRPSFAVVARKSRGIASPKDLEGKRLGVSASGSTFSYWPIFVKTTGIDEAKVTIENIGIPVREPMLAAGQLDAATGMALELVVGLKERGVPPDDIVVMQMSDYGVELYGDAVIVNTKFAAEHDGAVKGLLRAMLKGLKDTVRSPANAVASVLRRDDSLAKSTETERLVLAIRSNILTSEVKANGYGAIDPQRFARVVDQLAIAYRFKSKKPTPEDVFDASFLPSAAERRAN